jgi:lysophospholipase L1-like esterase
MYMGGRTCKRLANTLNATPIDTLATYLKELKNRQITAGGSGKILFLVQCGTNDIVEPETTTENFLTNMRSIINRLDIACYAASISKDNFGFIVMVSHPMNSTDTDVVTQSNSMTAYREIIAERSESNVLNLPVTSMNLLALKGTFNSTYDRLNDQQLYGSSNTDFMHLSSAGYDELGIPIIQNLLNYVPASRPPDYGIDITNGDKQNIVNGRFAVEWSNV